MNPNSTQLIGAMLVPGILILAAAVLLFSTNSKYSIVVERIRELKLKRDELNTNSNSSKGDANTRNSIELQLSHLIHRISMVRIIIVSYSAAVLFFTVSCVLLGIRSSFEVNGYFWVSIGFFFMGLLGIINGVIFSVIEIFKGYRIIHIEISEINQELSVLSNKE